MRLLGVNAGVVRDQVISGVVLRTAHVKRPVPPPWSVAAAGIPGDEVAAHTDHLYAFDRAGYDFWAGELGTERAAWPDGTFAENLTLDRIDLHALRLGDVLGLGGAALVVTGPRIPCAKLTWRLGQPPSFMERFRTSGRSGVYLGVLRPGPVAPGDEVRVLSTATDSPTVAQIARLASADPVISPDEHARLEACLVSPHLSASVRQRLENRLAAAVRRERRATRGWAGWRRFTVAGPHRECEDVASYLLTPADGEPLPSFEPGQHVAVRLGTGQDGQVVRTWSLSRHDERPTDLRVSVKALPGGRGGQALALAAADGHHVEVRAPAGSMTLAADSTRAVVMVAAGVGVTPFVAMAQAHLRRPAPRPPVWLFLTTATDGRTPFLPELAELFDGEDRHLVRTLTRSGGVSRRLDAAAVVEAMAGHAPLDRDAAPWFEADFHLCGPPTFVEELRSGLVAAGAAAHRVACERFEAAQDAAAPGRGTPAQVVFRESGVRTTWDPDEPSTLLELGEAAGLTLPSDCRSGSCHACEATLLAGEVDGGGLDGTGPTPRVLLCSAHPRSDEVIVGAP